MSLNRIKLSTHSNIAQVALLLIIVLLPVVSCEQRSQYLEDDEYLTALPEKTSVVTSPQTIDSATQITTNTLTNCIAPCWADNLVPGQTTQAQVEEHLPMITGFPSGQIGRNGWGDFLTFSFPYLPNKLPIPDSNGGRANLLFSNGILRVIILTPNRVMLAEDIINLYGEPDQILISSSSPGERSTFNFLYERGIRIMMDTMNEEIDSSGADGFVTKASEDLELLSIHYLPPLGDGTFANLFEAPSGWPVQKYDAKAISECTMRWRGYGEYRICWQDGPPELSN